MFNAEFIFDNISTIIQCNSNETMKEISQKFETKLGKDFTNKKIYNLYNA